MTKAMAVLGLAVLGAVHIPDAAGQKPENVLDNAAIVMLTEAGLPATAIVARIGIATATDFDTAESALAALTAAGVDAAEIEAMVREAGSAPVSPVSRPSGSPPVSVGGGPSVPPPPRLCETQAAVSATALRPGDRFSEVLSSGGCGPEMVVIPAGQFRMGCVSGLQCGDDEFPVHDVTIPAAFAVGAYEVTFEEWDACVAAGGCGGYRPHDGGWGRGRRPVIYVSWDDAQAYVAWLSRQTGAEYRLLSEAEWEYAARAGTETVYSWGNELGTNRANCEGCGSQWDDRQTAPVGSFPANAFGLHDMHGNVSEWVEDFYNRSYQGAPSDGSAWLKVGYGERVFRGGSSGSDPKFLRSAHRDRFSPGLRATYRFGFRVARTLAP